MALLVLALTIAPVFLPAAALAAEVLQVRGPTLLQIGDGNRSVPVELACIAPAPERSSEAISWLRAQLPRHTRVQLRPVGQRDGHLIARVRRLDSDVDLGAGLIAADLASPAPECA